MTTLNFGAVQGLTGAEQRQLQDLAGVYQYPMAFFRRRETALHIMKGL